MGRHKRRGLGELRRFAGQLSQGITAVFLRKAARGQAELNEIVIRIFGVDGMAPVVINLQHIAPGGLPLSAALLKLGGILHVEGDVIDVIG